IHVALLPALRRARGVRSGAGPPPGPGGRARLLARVGDHARRPGGLLGRASGPGRGVPGDERLVLAGRGLQLRHGVLAALRSVRQDVRRPAMSGPADFVHLQIRSHYSLMRGASSLEALCEAAIQRGMRAIACTDVDGLYGAVRFREIALAAGLRPILGAEVTAPDARRLRAGERATLLVKTPEGYANLCRILTRRHLDAGFSVLDALRGDTRGLVILSSSLAVLQAALEARGPDGLHLALGSSASPSAAEGVFHRLRAARRLGIGPVAVNDVHFVDAGGFDLHRLLRAIALNTTLDRVPPEDLASPQAWLKPPREMERAYPHCPEAVAATARLAEECVLDAPPWGR